MSMKHIGSQSVALANPPSIAGHACVVGEKEGQGPLKDSFDFVSTDMRFGKDSWEKGESEMVRRTLELAIEKAGQKQESIEYLFGGDLLNQCIGTTFGIRDSNIPLFGVYGACSTMAEGLSLAAMMIDGGFADITAAITSSHFCTSERQYRFPMEYGGQRPPTAQWTVTGSGAVVLTNEGPGPYITHITTGKIVDAGIKDANNMGAAMAPAAYETLRMHFKDLSFKPSDYDLIVTGDLGQVGSSIVLDFFKRDGINLMPNYNDCGLMIFSQEKQDVHAGGSGCGCSAAVLCGYLLNGMRTGRWNKILFAGTGAMLSTTSSQQKESIPSICHAVSISNTK